jgi:Cysteine rich repeat
MLRTNLTPRLPAALVAAPRLMPPRRAAQRSKLQEVGTDCQEELSRQEREDADDIRLSVKLLRACRPDQARRSLLSPS